MINIRKYNPSDWEAIEKIHDEARKMEVYVFERK